MSREWLDMSVQQIAAKAPRARAFYDRYSEDALDAMEDQWPTKAGVVCLTTSGRDPGWLCVRQTPDAGLLESWGTRMSRDDNYQILAQREFGDRIAGLDAVRRRVARVAQARANHVEGTSEWFKVSEAAAQSALMAD